MRWRRAELCSAKMLQNGFTIGVQSPTIPGYWRKTTAGVKKEAICGTVDRAPRQCFKVPEIIPFLGLLPSMR